MPRIDLHWMKKYGQQKLRFYLLSSSYYDYVSVYVEYTQLLVSWISVTQKCLGQAVSSVRTLTGMILS